MAILDIILYPDELLETKTNALSPEEAKSYDTALLMRNMIDTCLHRGGVGLSANQVGFNKALFIYSKNRRPQKASDFSAVINPAIIAKSGKITSRREGCLSIPNHTFDVKRYKSIVVEHLDIEGSICRFKAKTNFMSKLLQHEIDHLNGITLIDRMS
jgi:peptide deformylase